MQQKKQPLATGVQQEPEGLTPPGSRPSASLRCHPGQLPDSLRARDSGCGVFTWRKGVSTHRACRVTSQRTLWGVVNMLGSPHLLAPRSFTLGVFRFPTPSSACLMNEKKYGLMLVQNKLWINVSFKNCITRCTLCYYTGLIMTLLVPFVHIPQETICWRDVSWI